jgi:hypothetical protein
MANQIAYGFINLRDQFDQRVTEVGVRIIDAAIEASVAEHNRQLDALLGLFVERTLEFKLRYKTASTSRNQPLSADGRALPIKPGAQYDVAFPLQRSGNAWGFGYEAGIKMTVQEANNATNTLLMGDIRWMRDHILAALFYNAAGWSFTDDVHGSLTINGLANGDTVTYQILSGSDAGATDDHYLGQAAAIADATNPYPTLKTELTEHPENGGAVVALIASNLRATTEALASFHPFADANLRLGSGQTELVGTLGVPVPGQVIGYEDSGVWVAEWAHLPSSYILATTTEGTRPLAMREDTAPELRGFRRVADRDDHPWYERQYLRKAGFGGLNRVGAVAMEISDASFDIPTGYTSPMA